MSWLDRLLAAIKGAAIIGERVERLGGEVVALARELREIDRRVSRLEGRAPAHRPGRRARKTRRARG
jgi:hypothetical protein